jgi:hypothetical protein
MELEIIMLNKISQAQRSNISCFLSFMESRPKVMMMMGNCEKGKGKRKDAEG